MKTIHSSTILLSFTFVLGGSLLSFACQGGTTDEAGQAGAKGLGGASQGSGGSAGEDGSGSAGEANSGGSAGEASDPEPAEECPSGVALLMSDFLSTEIALLDLSGDVKDPSFLSTGSTATDGLAFPLSGDVFVPFGRAGELVVLDRYGTNVVSFVNPETGKVRAQLPVGMGFESNPYDYLQLSEDEGALLRFAQNPSPGSQAFDEGGDLLFIDTKEAKISSNVVFESYEGLPPGPSHLTVLENELFVTLERLSTDYTKTGEAMIVPVSLATRKVGKAIVLKGLKSCGALVPVPGRDEVATACTGRIDTTGEAEDLSQSALVFFDTTSRPLRELRRLPAKAIAGEPLQAQVAFASEQVALLKTLTAYGGDKHNRLLAVDLDTEETTELLEALPDGMGRGRGVSFGTIHCAPGCSDVCLMPDGSRGQVARIQVRSGRARLESPTLLGGTAGLPPANLGSY